ncbi:MAG: nucleotidyl transferase AbiEii/AbiGii toxin family protein [Patescibacteria group bacterium]|jgi:predicted nucleotidyltransferase component of viral defense system
MLNLANLQEFTKRSQTNSENVIREYCQHVFLSVLYRQPGAENLLFKGGTALRIVFHSPRFSEDLDFTGSRITQREVEELFTETLTNIEKNGFSVELEEAKNTSGGYLGEAIFRVYDQKIIIRIEVSLRAGKPISGIRKLIENDYIPEYSLVHLAKEAIVQGKLEALLARHKPRDFYDYFFLLSDNYPLVREAKHVAEVRKLLQESKLDFRRELRQFLPASHAMHLRDFRKVLEQKLDSIS